MTNTTTTVTVDWKEFQDKLGLTLTESLRGLVDAAEEDAKVWGEKIAAELIKAVLANDVAARKELIGQAKMLAELNRVRLVNEQSAVVDRVLGLVIDLTYRLVGKL